MGRLDDKYYKIVLKITDPKEILHVVRESRRVEKNVTHTSVRAKLYKLKLIKNDKIAEFNTLFDNIVTEYENCENAVSLTEEEKRSAYYQAISDAVPEIKASDLTQRRITKNSMTLDELKTSALELEAERRSEVNHNDQDPVVHQAKRFKSNRDKCRRCNEYGHYFHECPLTATNRWYCYSCKTVTDHNSANCPQKDAGTSTTSKPKQTMKFNTYRGRGRGRTNYRGHHRGNFRGGIKNNGNSGKRGTQSKKYDKQKPAA